MKIIAVEDEIIALEGILAILNEAAPGSDIHGFRYGEDAIEYCKKENIDVAFLDIQLGEMTGIEVGDKLIEINPKINVIFTTGFGSYRDVAFSMHASGYITKPVTLDKVKRELADLRRPVETNKAVRVKTFGNFEVYINNKPVAFKYNKTKELFAYLVDRKGSLCSFREILTVLFEDDDGHENYLKSLRRDLLDDFTQNNLRDVIVSQRGSLAIDPEKLDCDYYDYQDGKPTAPFMGEYMLQYSWAETTCARLDQ